MRCPICGRFTSKNVAHFNMNGDIILVEGFCKRHGRVNPEDWEYDDFVKESLIERRKNRYGLILLS